MDGGDKDRFRRWLLMGLATFGILLLASLFWALWINRTDCVATDLVVNNWKVILGLPFMSLASFIIVALFRQPSDPIEFSAIGFSLKGSAGEIVLWCICFLSMVGAVKILAGPDQQRSVCTSQGISYEAISSVVREVLEDQYNIQGQTTANQNAIDSNQQDLYNESSR